MRTLLILMACLLPLGTALGLELVTFPHDRLVIVGMDGHRHTFEVELAQTVPQQTQGLMYRRTMPGDAGMLFDFHQVKPIAMWMKNTLLPLDMIFIAQDGTVAGIAERAVPQSEDIITSPVPVLAVLEVNGGTAARLGIKTGDRVEYPLFQAAKH